MELANSSSNSSYILPPSNSSYILPPSIAAFAPFILAVLAVAAVSNTLLLALVIKARKVQNNTNIYLASLSTVGLLEVFALFTLFVTVVSRRWVFGTALCVMSSFFFRVGLIGILLLHLVISRDRYNAVKDPFHWHPRTKRAYICTAIVWIVSILFSLPRTLQQMISNSPKPDNEDTPFICNGLNNHSNGETIGELIVVVILYILFAGAISIITLGHYIFILRELHMVEKLRTQYRMLSSPVLKVNGRDKPLQCTAEERAAKSLALIFLIQFVCSFVSQVVACIRVIQSVTRGTSITDFTDPAETVLCFIILYLPATNPAVLILTNKKFRNRVKGLFKCELKPEMEDSGGPRLKKQQSIKLPNMLDQTARGMSSRMSIFVRGKRGASLLPPDPQHTATGHFARAAEINIVELESKGGGGGKEGKDAWNE